MASTIIPVFCTSYSTPGTLRDGESVLLRKTSSWEPTLKETMPGDAGAAQGVRESQDLAWIVNKFGGTSVASAQAIRSVRDIVMSQVQR